jgi:integrase
MPSITIDEFRTRVLHRYEARGRAHKTRTQIKQVLRELAAVGVCETGQITDTAIEDWILAWPERSPVTFKSHLRCLCALCSVMKKKDWIPLDPFIDDPVASWLRDDSRPSPPRRRYSLSPGDVRRILARAELEARSGSWEACRDQAFVNTVFLTGARVGEVERFETSDLDRIKKTLSIHAKWVTNARGKKVWWKPKTVGSAAEIPIGDHLLEMLLLWSVRLCRPYRRQARVCPWLFPGKRLMGPWVTGSEGNTPLDRVRALGERAGVFGVTNKAGRKGIGTHRDIGLTPQGRREHFRHSDDATGDFYDERDVESRRADAIKIERFYLFGT